MNYVSLLIEFIMAKLKKIKKNSFYLEFLILRSYNGANKFDYGDEIMIQVFSKATSYQRYL